METSLFYFLPVFPSANLLSAEKILKRKVGARLVSTLFYYTHINNNNNDSAAKRPLNSNVGRMGRLIYKNV